MIEITGFGQFFLAKRYVRNHCVHMVARVQAPFEEKCFAMCRDFRIDITMSYFGGNNVSEVYI